MFYTRNALILLTSLLGSATALKFPAESKTGSLVEIKSELLQSSTELTPSDAKLALATGTTNGKDPMQLKVHIGNVYMSTAQLAYGGSIMAMFVVVVVMYWYRGVFTILRVLVYLGALSTMTLTIKSILANYGYNYPKIISFSHFAACGVACFGIMAFRHIKHGAPFPVPTLKEQITGIFPVAVGFALGIGFNNMALSYAGAGFVEMVGSSTLLCVVVLTLLMGKPFNAMLGWPLLVVGIGVCMCATGELKFSTLGIFFAFGANFMRALKGVLQQHLLCAAEDSTRTKLDPHELLAWMSLPSMAIMLGWSLVADGAAPFVDLVNNDNLLGLLFAMLISCSNAVILNLSNLFLTKDLGALGVNVTGQLKGILIILGSVAIMGERISMVQLLGYITIVVGAAGYNVIEKAETDALNKKQAQFAEKTPLIKRVC